MAILATITQQPRDKRDYDINFSEWFPVEDTVTGADIYTTPFGLTVGYAVQHPRVKVWINGGVDGVTYMVNVVGKTLEGRVKEVELKVRVKEVK